MEIIDNGKHSLKKSIDKLKSIETKKTDEYEYELKDIILNLHHSIETMCKHIVAKNNKYLIYSNCEDIFSKKVFDLDASCNKKTISFLDSVNRSFVLNDMSIEKNDYRKFVRLNELRNDIIHYKVDFIDNEVEHLVTLLLPVLLRLFNSTIDKFGDWAKNNNIYDDVNTMVYEVNTWSIKQYIEFKTKWMKSKKIIKEKDKNKNKLNHIKDSSKVYKKCPSCGKKLFESLGLYIVDSEQILYSGKCHFCNLEVTRLNLQFISLTYGDIYSYDDNGFPNILQIILKEFFYLNEDYNYHIHKDKEDLLFEYIMIEQNSFKRAILNETEHLVEYVLEKIFMKNYYNIDDSMREIIEFKNSKLEVSLLNFRDFLLNECNKDIFNNLKKLITIIKMLEKKNIELSLDYKEVFNNRYISYLQGMYLDFEGEDNWSEIEVYIDLNYEDLYNYLN